MSSNKQANTELRKGMRKDAKCNINLTGKKIGRLRVKRKLNDVIGLKAEYECECSCGKIIIKTQEYLIDRHTTLSCGCARKNAIYAGEHSDRLYNIYKLMIERCYNPKSNSYKYYGGKGVTVCKPWLKESGFECFYRWAINNGYKPNLTIDRIDTNKGYTARNCRWTDKITQANNKTNNIHIRYKGETMTLANYARLTGVNYGKIYKLIKNDSVYSGEYLEEKIKENL